MHTALRLAAFAATLSAAAFAQAPAAKPANATGQCKDGTYSTAASKAGACRGHNGVKDWYVAAAPASPAPTTAPPKPGSVAPGAPATAAKPTAPAPAPLVNAPAAPTAPPATAAKAAPAKGPRANLASTPIAPGGGPGLVWVNTSSNVYHCPNTDFYGKTKAGAYMSESAAKAKGARPDHGNACSK